MRMSYCVTKTPERLIMSISLIYQRKLGFLDSISGKKQFFLFATKFIRISRQIKQDKQRKLLYQIQMRMRFIV